MMRLPFKHLYIFLAVVLSAALLLTPACVGPNTAAVQLKEVTSLPLSITLLHVNDTHSYVIPHDIKLRFNDKDTLVTVGGWSLLMAAIEDIRSREQNVVLLHAGDVIEGTIWTTKFGGLTDIDAMNTLQFDALTPGDNEFAKSLAEAAAMIKKAKFPVLAANMDVSHEPSLAGSVKPYTVVESGGQLIGVIGLVNPDIALYGNMGKNIIISAPLDAARKYVSELNDQGINKIIVLSHLGYRADAELAAAVPGIDIIVGGHSATLMGGDEFQQVGLKPEMTYPVEMKGPAGDRVLIVQAWENNQLLGQIKLDFDEKGRIANYSGLPFIVAMNSFQFDEPNYGWLHLCSCRPEFGQILELIAKNTGIKLYWDNAEMSSILQPYISEISAELNTTVGTADEDLSRGFNKGPGPLVADAFLWSARKANPDVQLAIYESSKIRGDIYKGLILANAVHMVLPFRQTLSIITMPGAMLKTMLEEGIDSCIAAGKQPPYYEISGFRITIDMSRKSGDRITRMQLQNADGSYMDMNVDGKYTLAATDSYVETGMLSVLKYLGPLANNFKGWLKDYYKYANTGIKDVDALTDYLKVQKNVKNVTEERTLIMPSAVK